MTRGERIIAFIEAFCRVPEGKLIGQPIKLLPFQRRFILEVFDNPAGTKTGILSIGRKNGKTALIACILLAFIAGPEARHNAQICSGARSKEQASLVFRLACKIIRLSPELSTLIKIVPSGKRLIGLMRNVEYQALSAEAGTAHGLSPYLLILDELGQVRGEQDDFVEALETAQGAYDDAIKLVISTQAPTDADMLSILIDDAKTNQDPKTVCHIYEAAPDAEITDRKAWAAANPALGVFRSMVDMETEAASAARMPSRESGFRNLYLNQRVNRNNPLITRDVWKANGGAPDLSVFARCPVYAGLDLSKTTDLTAFVMVSKDEAGLWHVLPTFWKPADLVEDHEKRDRVPYARWVRDGVLQTTPGVAVGYGFVAREIARLISGKNIIMIGFDNWKFDQLKPWLEEYGVPDTLFHPVIQGPKTFSPFIDLVETELLDRKVRHGGHEVLTNHAANAVAVSDSNENRKLDKSRSTGRIDGIVAMTMAMGLAGMGSGGEEKSFWEVAA